MTAFVMAALLTVTGTAHAAVDADLTTALASSTSLVTDNKSTILTFIAAMVGLVLVIKLGKVALYKAKGMIVSAFKK